MNSANAGSGVLWSESCKVVCSLAFMFQLGTMQRGSELAQTTLGDLWIWRVQASNAGINPLVTINAAVRESKTNKGGDKDVRMIPRNQDVLACSQFAAAQLIFDVIGDEVLDIAALGADSDGWLLFPGTPERSVRELSSQSACKHILFAHQARMTT
jgi:hypothetical protein